MRRAHDALCANHASTSRNQSRNQWPSAVAWTAGCRSFAAVKNDESASLQEPVRKRVGGSLAHGDPLARVEALRRNARALPGEKWKPRDDGTLVRKAVGKAR